MAQSWNRHCLMFVAGLLMAGAAAAQVPIPVDIPWSGNRPDRVEMLGPSGSVGLPFVPPENRFRGAYPRSRSIAFDPVTLVARRGNQDERVAFLRVSPDLRTITLQMLIPSYTECRLNIIEPLLRSSNDRDITLDSYFRARALFLLDNANRCLGERKKDVARAWFDRSFELVTLDCLFRLSPEAAQAYAFYDQQYVADRQKKADLREIGCRNEARGRLWAAGEYADAFAVGEELNTYLTENPQLRGLATEQRALSLDRFAEEQRQLGGYLAATSAWHRDRLRRETDLSQPASAPASAPPR
jgi:hypothetical protein